MCIYKTAWTPMIGQMLDVQAESHLSLLETATRVIRIIYLFGILSATSLVTKIRELSLNIVERQWYICMDFRSASDINLCH